jgi:hypothetical protein
VCAAEEVDEDDDEEYEVGALEISSSRSRDDVLVTVDECDDIAVALTVAAGACAANQAPRPRKDAALTTPVMRRARRAGWGCFREVMHGGCARSR